MPLFVLKYNNNKLLISHHITSPFAAIDPIERGGDHTIRWKWYCQRQPPTGLEKEIRTKATMR